MDAARLIIAIAASVAALACGMALGYLLWLSNDNGDAGGGNGDGGKEDR